MNVQEPVETKKTALDLLEWELRAVVTYLIGARN